MLRPFSQLGGRILMRLYVSEAGVRLPGSTVRWVSCGVSLVLAVTLLTGPPTPVVAAEADTGASGDAALVKSRPDVVSAAVTARAQGKRVEVEGLRTETETTFANPDGTMTTDTHLAPVRYQDDKDAWHKVDLDLGEDQAGTVSPEATATDLTLAGGEKDASGKDGTDLARVVEPLTDDREAVVAMQAPGELGTPVLEENTATYEDVTPDADVFVRATQRGFEQQLVLNTPEALDEYTSEDGTVAWRIPVRTAGVTPRAEDDGSVSFVTAGGTVISRVVAPFAWDAQVDAGSGDPASPATVDLTVEETQTGTNLVVTPDQEWVKAADRQFPITIDPTYAYARTDATGDRHVSKASPNTNFEDASELRVGTYNGGGDVTRSYINFAMSAFRGRDITKATLSLYETHSYSCSPREFYVRSADFTDSSTTWNNQPATGNHYATVDTAKGFSSACAATWVRADVTALARAWSTKPTSVTKLGVRLSAS